MIFILKKQNCKYMMLNGLRKPFSINDLHKAVGGFAMGESTKAKTRTPFGIRVVSVCDVRDVRQVEGQHGRLPCLLRRKLPNRLQFGLGRVATVNFEANLTLRIGGQTSQVELARLGVTNHAGAHPLIPRRLTGSVGVFVPVRFRTGHGGNDPMVPLDTSLQRVSGQGHLVRAVHKDGCNHSGPYGVDVDHGEQNIRRLGSFKYFRRKVLAGRFSCLWHEDC